MFCKIFILLIFLHWVGANPANSGNCDCVQNSRVQGIENDLSETFQQFVGELEAIRNSNKPVYLQCGSTSNAIGADSVSSQGQCDCYRYAEDIRQLNETVQQLVAEAITTINGTRIGGFCRVPNIPVSDYVTTDLPGGSRVGVGQSITYTCNQGYWIAAYEVGNLVVSCRGDQTWTDPPPTCEPGNCFAGLKDGRIKNDQITASSYYSTNWLPSYGRLDRSRGTWHPARNYTGSWLQVDFLIPTRIVGVITQGFYSNNAWITGFKIAYGPTPYQLKVIQNHYGGDKVFQAHVSHGSHHMTNRFRQPVTARYFRFIVVSYISDNPHLRMEYLLC